jgi:large subunit ribosomal protein L10
MLTKQQKLEQSEALRTAFADVNTLFLLDNTGLTVNQVNELRNKVRETEGVYKVVKNSVVKMAIEGTDKEGLAPHLTGPKALAFTTGDGIALAKALKGFIKNHPELSFQQVYLEGQVLDAAGAEQVAELPSREELISKLLYVLQSPMRRLAVALNSPVQKLASALSQIADQSDS